MSWELCRLIFRVGDQPVPDFRMVERHYLKVCTKGPLLLEHAALDMTGSLLGVTGFLAASVLPPTVSSGGVSLLCCAGKALEKLRL